MNADVRHLTELSEDLEKLSKDNKNDAPKMSHDEFKKYYLDLFLGRPNPPRNFLDWYHLVGFKSTYVEIYDIVDGEVKMVYKVPPLLNRKGITANNVDPRKTLTLLFEKAYKKANKLPRIANQVLSQVTKDATLTDVEPDDEAYEAWLGLLKYNGYKVKQNEGTGEATGGGDFTTEVEYISEEISWDEDAW